MVVVAGKNDDEEFEHYEEDEEYEYDHPKFAKCKFCGANLRYAEDDVVYDEFGEGGIICPSCNRELIVVTGD